MITLDVTAEDVRIDYSLTVGMVDITLTEVDENDVLNQIDDRVIKEYLSSKEEAE